MTKLAIAALALGLAGAGALAAIGARRVSCGLCPLTGAPIAHAAASHVSLHASGATAADARTGVATDVAADASACPVEMANRCARAAAAQCPECPDRADCPVPCEEKPLPDCCRKKCEEKQQPKQPAENP